jgi:hypothetical protein
MWRLAVARQQLLLVALGLVLLDASAVAASIGALRQGDTFASFANALFEDTRTLADALDRAAGGNGASIVAVLVYVIVRPWPQAWIRASYIKALAGTGGFPRPTWPSVFRLVLLDLCIGTPLVFGSGILEKAGLEALAPPIVLAAVVLTLYADYAIVIDDLGLWRSLHASVHVLLRRPAASLGATAAWLLLSFILYGSLGPSFDAGATPLTLTALFVFTGVLTFGLDVCLITLYRATPPAPEPGQEF